MKKLYIFMALSILSVFLHNLISAIFKFEEPVFFTAFFVFMAAFIVSTIHYLIAKQNNFRMALNLD